MITLDASDTAQILRYLGYRNTGLTEADERNISEAIELTNSIIRPSCVWKLYSLQYMAEGILLLPAGVRGAVAGSGRSGTADTEPGGLCILSGESIRRHLNGVTEAVLLAVTIGRDFDVEVEKAMVRNPSFGVILNACGIQAVEKLADTLQLEIDKRLAGTPASDTDERAEAGDNLLHTGIRFSPGYGDLPLESQRDFIRLLDATRKAGITLNESCLMNPLKSVTAIAGIISSR